MKKTPLTLVAIIFAANFSFAALNRTFNSWNAGTSPDKPGYRVMEKADTGLSQADTVFSATASGNNTYTATITPAITAYTSHQIFNILFTNTNTVPQRGQGPSARPITPTTLNLNGLGAIPITKMGGTAIITGDIVAGQILSLQYDGTNFQILGDGGNSAIWNVPLGHGPQTASINITGNLMAGETIYGQNENIGGGGIGHAYLQVSGGSTNPGDGGVIVFSPGGRPGGAIGNFSTIGASAGFSRKFGITGTYQSVYLDPPLYGGVGPYEVIIGDTLNSDGNELRVTGNSTFSGFVGIGTASPHGYQLAVNGSAIATSVTVMLNASWPDYVFKKDYKLPSLASLKTYISQNHRLPGMPSAQEVAKNGLNLGETDKLLTKKVEELTLYAVQSDQKNKDLETRLARQQAINRSDEARIKKLEQEVELLLRER